MPLLLPPSPGRRLPALAAVVAVLLALGGCGPQSRLDDALRVDVCSLVSRPEMEHVLGPLSARPHATASGPGVAGSCQWEFRPQASAPKATLDLMLVTARSADKRFDLKQWFRLSRSEVEASLGASAWEMKDLGSEAFLVQSVRPEQAELWMRQGATYAALRMSGGSASQLREVAVLLSRALEPKDAK